MGRLTFLAESGRVMKKSARLTIQSTGVTNSRAGNTEAEGASPELLFLLFQIGFDAPGGSSGRKNTETAIRFVDFNSMTIRKSAPSLSVQRLQVALIQLPWRLFNPSFMVS